MTKHIQESYRDYVNNKISKKTFQYHLSRNSMAQQYITVNNSIEDSIKILRNKGVLVECECENKPKTESAVPTPQRGYVSPTGEKEFYKGIDAELLFNGTREEFGKDDSSIEKAFETAFANLQIDKEYYNGGAAGGASDNIEESSLFDRLKSLVNTGTSNNTKEIDKTKELNNTAVSNQTGVSNNFGVQLPKNEDGYGEQVNKPLNFDEDVNSALDLSRGIGVGSQHDRINENVDAVLKALRKKK